MRRSLPYVANGMGPGGVPIDKQTITFVGGFEFSCFLPLSFGDESIDWLL